MKTKLIWLEACGCSGNIISFLNASTPTIETLLNDYIDITFDNSLNANYGEYAMEDFFKTVNEGNYILVIEGALATNSGGIYNIIGKYNNQYLTGLEAAVIAHKNSKTTIAVGNCASFGSVSAAPPNPSGSKSVPEVLGNRVIRMPCCPCSGDWIASLLMNICQNKNIELDNLNRPTYLYGVTIHDRCTRRSFFDKGIFATKLGEMTCMFKLGCKGPTTKAPCPITRWNGFVNWPVDDNTPCIGCGKETFPNYQFFSQEAGRND